MGLQLQDPPGKHPRFQVGTILLPCLFLVATTLLHLSSSAQTAPRTITLDMKNATVQKVLKEAARQARISIVYQESIFQNFPRVNIKVKDATIDQVLDQCLGSGSFKRQTEGGVITLKKIDRNGIASQTQMPTSETQMLPTTIRGVILDKDGRPIDGASIRINGPSQRSVVANSKGEFATPQLKPGAYTVTASSVGFKNQEKTYISTNSDAALNFVLEKTWNESKEVVVNGLYARPKENFTGAASSYTGEELRQVNPKSVIEALKGLDASIQVPSDNIRGSDPNNLPRLQVRGTNSIMQTDLKSEYGYISNPPLIIIDGFESTLQALFDLDINRIAKVTILKDAAATAIYGSKSANGVIVVQTVQPKAGKVQVNYTTTLSANVPDLGSFNLANAQQKLQFETIAGVYKDRKFTTQQQLNDQYNLVLHNVQKGINTYWLSQPLQTEFAQEHHLSIAAGSEKIVYMATFAYRKNGGIMKGSDRENLDGILNVRFNSLDHKLTIQSQFSIGTVNATNSPYGDFGDYAKMNPYWMARDQNGRITRYADIYPLDGGNALPSNTYTSTVINPLYNSTLNIVDKSHILNIGQNFWTEYAFTKDLKVNSTFSYTNAISQSDQFLPGSASQFFSMDFPDRGSYTRSHGGTSSIQSNTTMNFGKNLGKHTLFATAGVSLQQNSDQRDQVSVKGFPSSRLNDLLFGLQYSSVKPQGSYSLTRTMGYLANTSYAYDNRYLMDFSIRSDGSSIFGSKKRFGQIWAGGIGWNLHNERFIHLPHVINRMKLTTTYGFTGSVNFPSYASATTYRYNTTGRYLDFVPATVVALGNPDLLWQRTKKFNAGLDLSLFNNRLNITMNVYKETTDDLIMSNQSAPSTGFDSYYNNLGKSQNKGYEISMTAFLLKKPEQKLYWSISTSYYHNENKLLQITDALQSQNKAALALQKDSGYNKPVLQYQTGKSVSTLYAVRSLGIDPSNGYEIFLTKDGKQTYVWNQADEVAMGDMQPKFNMTFNNNFQWKWLRLNFSIRIQAGGVMYNSTLADKVENVDLHYNVDKRALQDRWQKTGQQSAFKGLTDLEGYTRPSDPTIVTSRFVQRANTIEITGINLDPGALLERAITKYTNLLINKINHSTEQVLKSNMLNVRFYMNNAFTISSLKRERGTSYPFNRTYSMSISLNF